jgi:hypothetical protein
MAKIRFREVKLSQANQERLHTINEIIEEYQDQDLVLTLRQLYYQLVSRDIIPNKQNEYAKLSTLLKEGRMGGIVDWDAIEDRLRQPYTPSSFNSPKEILQTALNQYMCPRMEGQENYIEVWVEKDALSGVLKRVTSLYHIPILVNRGYSSASAMFDSYERFAPAIEKGRKCTVLYLGDFDPSGMDMIRDIRERIREFLIKDYIDDIETDEQKEEDIDVRVKQLSIWFNNHFEIVPIALTEEQIQEYDPPENPAKRTDPRAAKFIEKHGSSSWEVDALRPEVLNQVLTDAIVERIDEKQYRKMVAKEKSDKKVLSEIIKSVK